MHPFALYTKQSSVGFRTSFLFVVWWNSLPGYTSKFFDAEDDVIEANDFSSSLFFGV